MILNRMSNLSSNPKVYLGSKKLNLYQICSLKTQNDFIGRLSNNWTTWPYDLAMSDKFTLSMDIAGVENSLILQVGS